MPGFADCDAFKNASEGVRNYILSKKTAFLKQGLDENAASHKALDEIRNETIEDLADVHNQIADFSGKEKPFGIKEKKVDTLENVDAKFIAQQAQNVQDDGSISDLQTPKAAYDNAVKAFGKEKVDAAIKAHPLESLVTKNVSDFAKQEIESEIENTKAGIDAAKLDEDFQFEGVGIKQLNKDLEILQGKNPVEYFERRIKELSTDMHSKDSKLDDESYRQASILSAQYQKIYDDLTGNRELFEEATTPQPKADVPKEGKNENLLQTSGIVKQSTNKAGNTFFTVKRSAKWFDDINKFFSDKYGIDAPLYHFQNNKSKKADSNGYYTLPDGTRMKESTDGKGGNVYYIQSPKFSQPTTKSTQVGVEDKAETKKEVDTVPSIENKNEFLKEDNPNVQSASEFYYEYEKKNPQPKRNTGIILNKFGRPVDFNKELYAKKMGEWNRKMNEAWIKHIDEQLNKGEGLSERQVKATASAFQSENRLQDAEKLLTQYGYEKNINGKWQPPNADIETEVKDIESKAESNNEADLNEAIQKADELISEPKKEVPAFHKKVDDVDTVPSIENKSQFDKDFKNEWDKDFDNGNRTVSYERAVELADGDKTPVIDIARKRWDKLSVEERKKVLQEYRDEIAELQNENKRLGSARTTVKEGDKKLNIKSQTTTQTDKIKANNKLIEGLKEELAKREKDNIADIESLEKAAEATKKLGWDSSNKAFKEAAEKLKEKDKPAFHKKVDDVADSLIKALSAKLPPGTQKQGIGIEEIIRGAADIIKKAHDIGGDIKKAINEAVAYVKKQFKDNNLGDVDENIIREHFENQEITGETPPPKPPVDNVTEGKEDDDKKSGIKKALVSEEIVKGVVLEKIPVKEMMALGRKIIDTGEVKPEALVTKIITEKSGVLTPSEVVAMITYKADIDHALRDAYKQANKKKEDGEDIGTTGVEIADLERQVHDFDVAAVITASQQSMAFRLRKMMLDRDYNVVTQIEKYKKNNNGYIPPEVEARFKEMDKQIKDLKEKISVAEKLAENKEANDAVNNIKESVDREKKYTEEELEKKVKSGILGEINKVYEQLPTDKKSIADKAIAALDKIQQKVRSKSYSDATGMVAFVDAGITTIKNAIKLGVSVQRAVELGIAEIKKRLGGKVWGKEDEFRKDMLDGFESEGVATTNKKRDTATINDDGTVSIPNQMLRDLVERGITDIDDLTDTVHEIVSKDLPDITKRQVRDSITNYGKQINPTADDIQQQVNTAKRVGKLLSELEDLRKLTPIGFALKYQKPKPTSAKITDRERELKKQIKSLGKDFIDAQDKDVKVPKSNSQRLEDAKKKVIESIAKVRTEIITRERELSEKKKPLNEDLELQRLLDSEAALKNLRDKYLPENPDAFEDEKQREKIKDKLVDDIIDLNEQINAGEKNQNQKNKFSDDVGLNKLREIKKAKQSVLDLLDPRAKEEVRIKQSIKSAEKSLAEYERRLAEKDTSPKVRDQKPSTQELDAIRKKRDVAKKEYEDFKKEQPKSDATRLVASKAAVKRRIAELERKLKNKDYSRKVKPKPVLDNELITLNAEKLKLQDEFDHEQEKNDLKNRTFWQKAEDVALELSSGLSRALVASIDFSAPFVQGVWRLFTNPIKSAKAFGVMFEHFGSTKRQDEWFAKLKAQPFYHAMEASKLAITDKEGKASAKEGLFISNWVNLAYNGLAKIITLGHNPSYQFIKKLNLYKASQRAFDGYVNSIRVQSFIKYAQQLEKDGYTFESDPQVFHKMSDHINTTTGRGGLGVAESSTKWLSILLFAPKKVIAEVKLFTPYAFVYYAKMPAVVRKKALLDFATFVTSFTASNALLWAAMKDGDDDEEDNFWNMNSSDFMTHKFGAQRISFLGGAKSALVFMSRLINGKFTDQYGRTTKLGERYGKEINTREDLAISFIKNKFSPTFAAASKKFDERKGLEVDDAELVRNLVIPIWTQDMNEVYKTNPVPIATMYELLSIFGANVRTVEPQNINTIKIKNPKTFKERSLTVEEDKKYRETIKKNVPELLKKFTSNNSTIWVDVNGNVHLSKEGGNITKAEKLTWKPIKSEKLLPKQLDQLEEKVTNKVRDAAEKTIKF